MNDPFLLCKDLILDCEDLESLNNLQFLISERISQLLKERKNQDIEFFEKFKHNGSFDIYYQSPDDSDDDSFQD